MKTMKSYEIPLDGTVITAEPFTILANVSDVYGPGISEMFWIVVAAAAGFVGIPVGREATADMRALPGQLWHDVTALGTTTDPEEYSMQTLKYEEIWSLFEDANN